MSDARRARLGRPWTAVPTVAVAGDLDTVPLRAGGWSVRGRLAASPFAGPPEDVPGYLDAGELLEDSRVDAVALDGGTPELVALLPSLRRAGLLVLLQRPAGVDLDVLQDAQAADGPPVGVGLVERWAGWARTVRAAVPLGGPPLQVTVRGWPRGAGAAAELVDLVRLWCGDVVAAVAAPAALPARTLPDGEPVSWALLTAGGATVLVSAGGDGPSVRVSFEHARLSAAPAGARWEGGEPLPLLLPPAWVPPAPRDVAPGLVATAAALSEAVGGRDLRPYGPGDDVEPVVAQLPDLLAVARVLAALRDSARGERLVPVS